MLLSRLERQPLGKQRFRPNIVCTRPIFSRTRKINSQKSSQAPTFLPQCFSEGKTALGLQLTKRTGFVETPGRRSQASPDSWKAGLLRAELLAPEGSACWSRDSNFTRFPGSVKSERGGGSISYPKKASTTLSLHGAKVRQLNGRSSPCIQQNEHPVFRICKVPSVPKHLQLTEN